MLFIGILSFFTWNKLLRVYDLSLRNSQESTSCSITLFPTTKIWRHSYTRLILDNQVVLHIALEIDCHFVREKVLTGDIIIDFVSSSDQLADMFTKSLKGFCVDSNCNKLYSYDICSSFSLRGSVEDMIWSL